MFAVIETGGKQYKVRPNQTVEVELLPLAPGSDVELDRVLLLSTDDEMFVGQPLVDGALVKATVARQGRGNKIIVFKYKSKKRYRRKTGHRQNYTYLTINDIIHNGESLVGIVETEQPAAEDEVEMEDLETEEETDEVKDESEDDEDEE
ncbi:MAG TPA: 50S ribosomal protein L21 [Ktedonobacterales bacterium]|nr:50S ribosomal protein L21 [Ktedonobacterales bacterium]